MIPGSCGGPEGDTLDLGEHLRSTRRPRSGMYHESLVVFLLPAGYLGVIAWLMGVYILEYKWDMAYTALELDCNCTCTTLLN